MTTTEIEPVHTQIAGNVRAILANYGCQQRELALWLDHDTGQITRLMNGQRRWRLDDVDKLARLLGIETWQVVGPRGALLTALPGDLPEHLQNLKHLMQYHSYDEISMVA